MTAIALLRELRRRGVTVAVDGNELDVSAPKGILSPELRAQLAAHKLDLIRLLNAVSGNPERIVPLERGDGGRAQFIASFAQQRLWFLCQLFPDNPFYNIPIAWRLSGELDVRALQASLDALVVRHETLRTIFQMQGESVVQVVASPEPVKLAFVDLSGLPQGEREAEARRRVEEEGQRPFDLSVGPLFRAQLLRLSAADHVLHLTMHHINSDGWSIPILFRDIGALYRARCSGEAPRLPELSIQYADFSVWQRNWLSGAVLSGQLDYWRGALEGLAELRLPSDRPRPALPSYRGARETLSLSPQLSAALRSLSQRNGATLYMVMLAAFNVLLQRYTLQDDIVVGSPIANRTSAELEDLIGFFVNSLVMRTDVSGDPSFTELVERVRRVALDAYAHQDLPFERLVEELDPHRDLSRNPLFQVMFIVQNAPGKASVLPGAAATLRAEGLPIDMKKTQLDLEVHIWEAAEQLRVDFVYGMDLFDAATIQRMLGHYERVLESVVENPERQLSELRLLGRDERHQLLEEWNATQADYPAGVLMHELVEDQVERTPERIAVVHEGRELSYGELNARANRLAHYLRGVGVGPDARVAICVERGIEMVVGLLAVLKAGGAYVPLDPAYPAERLAYMLQDSAPVAILTDAGVAALVQAQLRSVAGAALPVIDLQGGAQAWATQPAANPEPGAVGLKAAHLAYVIYTSGSTGKPKGVAIEHRNAVNFLCWARESFSAEQLAHTLFSTSLNFDLAMYECFAPLVVGATTRVVRNALELAQAPHPVTLINTVPSAIGALLEAGGVPPTVRTVNLAGEPLKRALVERLFAQTRVETVCNLYGPSETTTYSTWVAMRREEGFVAHIGRPLANTRIYLLDPRGEPVPVGVVGELYIGGAGVARGYLNRPELTAERFLRDPFAAEPDARMYKTGDLARYLAGGDIEFLGRNDFQVKIRGFRIELGEIEAALGAHPAIREAVVLAREDSPGDKRLVAYVAAPQPSADLAEQLRAHIRASLPEYMVPGAFVVLERLPLTPNGKLDRKALPAPDEAALASRGYEAPQGALEEKLAAIWAEVLKLERVGRHDNFFELGGHSLLAVTLIERMRRAGLNADVGTLFANPTLAALAEAMEDIEIVL